MGESGFLCHEPCPKCGSPDNMARYEDGHAHCFTEGCGYHEPPSGEASLAPQKAQSKTDSKFLSGEYAELTKRCLTLETCQKWGYQVGVYRGRGGEKPCQIANYRRDGRVVFQKIRFPDKGFKSIGDIEQAGLYGQHLWSGGRMIVITEGEIDAMSVSQVQNHRWPVVSIPNGVGGAVKALRREISWLEKFETIVLMFDMDEPGQEAAKKCALLFTPGKVRIAHLPLKDPNEMLQEGRGAELIQAIWNAKEYRPDGIVDGRSTWELYKAKKNVPSTPYPWPCFNQKTHGMRLGEIVTFTAGSGIGKSTVCRELAHYLLKCGERVGYIALEESVGKSTEALMSIECNTPLHLHPDKFTEPELFEIGCHSANHPQLTLCKGGELDAETLEPKRLLEERLQRSIDLFCYPTGMPGDYDAATRTALVKAGFRAALLAHGGLVRPATDPMQIPRIGAPVELRHFRSAVSGLDQLRGNVSL